MKKIIIFLFIIFFFSFVSADVISVNSGGSNVIVINPDTYIEGFFTCVPLTCAGLGYTCGAWSDGCAGTLDCGTCAAGFTCTAGTCVAIPPTGGGDAPGAGGGGPTVGGITVIPRQIKLRMAINTNKKEIIKITNKGDSDKTLKIIQNNLDKLVMLGESSITVKRGETKELELIFVAPEQPGIYPGTIWVGGYDILVTLNVKTKLLLFDSNIVVLNKDYKVSRGSELRTSVNLIPMGDQERLDVTLNYVIKDYTGKVYLTQSESVLVEKEINFKRNFGTGTLPLGKYVIGLELVYPGGVAPSSAHFEVVKKSPTDLLGVIIFFLIVFILIIGIILMIFLIKKRRDKFRKQYGYQ